MNNKIVATNKEHLIQLITQEITLNGNKCDLNHIDISKVTDFYRLFSDHDFGKVPYDNRQHENFSAFNGDISKWDVSNVKDMAFMFMDSKFNGDISQWNTSHVKNMNGLFHESDFNGDISKWDVSSVEEMDYIFGKISKHSCYEGDLSLWKPYNVYFAHNSCDNFCSCSNVPYWSHYYDKIERKAAIDMYHKNKNLEEKLHNELNKKDKTKKAKL
jgi:hypothetical protein